jgi:hypothetical protein
LIRASRDAALAVLDREKDLALYETTIRIRVIGEFRKSVDPGITGQFALRCRPVWPTARLNIQIISLDGWDRRFSRFDSLKFFHTDCSFWRSAGSIKFATSDD